jgi:hypothetical protein
MDLQETPHDLPEVQLADSLHLGASHVHHVGPGKSNANREEQRESDSATADLHLWWKEGSEKGGHTNTYVNVAVLLIRWQENLDELRCADEVCCTCYVLPKHLVELTREKRSKNLKDSSRNHSITKLVSLSCTMIRT